MRTHVIVVACIALIAITLGSRITSEGMDWYRSINLPSWTPAGGVIGAVWTVIYVLTSIAAILFWNKVGTAPQAQWIFWLFIINVVLNVGWSYLFFGLHQFAAAFVEMNALNLTTLALIILLRPISKTASLLLLPYFLWVSFATGLAYAVWQMN